MPDSTESELAVEVLAVRYRSDDGSFAVLYARAEDGRELTLTGPLAYVHEGEELVVRGRLRRHPRYGERFEVRFVSHPEPTSERAVLAALAAVRHIGPRGAERLYRRYGERTIAEIDADPKGRLRELPGIGRKRLVEAVASWEELRAQRTLRMFLAEHGVSAAIAARIQRVWGERSIAQLQADPYSLVDLPGVGFATADALARALGVSFDAPSRIDAAILYALARAELSGHCYLPRAELQREALALLAPAGEHDEDPELLWEGAAEELGARIDALIASGRLVAPLEPPEEAIYASRMYEVERRLAGYVRALADGPPVLDIAGRSAWKEQEGLSLSAEQWLAIERALANRISILTGGPGTGKTASMRALVAIAQVLEAPVRLCAPTGKAARRLAAASAQSATTIHRLLEWQPGSGFARNASAPLEQVGLLIVDEASMLSVRLAEALFAAVGAGTHVLLIGDSDQLPAIGPGRVLEDLIASGQIPVTRLEKIFRQARRSLIVRAAHAIREGKAPERAGSALAGEEVRRDFFFLTRAREEELGEEATRLACERLPARYDLDPLADVLVLAPMRRGPAGIEALNERLREQLNPAGEAIAGTPLRVGDRVIQTRNDHEHELMNGEIAILSHFDRDRSRAHLRLEDDRTLTLPFSALATIEPAYAISIHKAQGSQAPAVVVVLARSARIMLTRNLLYTAITRAERLCVLLAQPGALELALARRDARRRYTRLAEQLTLAGSRA
jgi:exodeoxyribonuclease V alpha subunit